MCLSDLVFIEFNNWALNYMPNSPIFLKNDLIFSNPDYCKLNSLCVTSCCIDMSISYKIAAPKDWVIHNCPEVLSDKKNARFVHILSDDEIKKGLKVPADSGDWEDLPWPEYKDTGYFKYIDID